MWTGYLLSYNRVTLDIAQRPSAMDRGVLCIITGF